MLRAVLLLLLAPLSGFGQYLSHPLAGSQADLRYGPRPILIVPDTVRVLATMVQFQADDDETTTGNGQFDLSNATEPVIDAPPHDGSFFLDHLIFLENYYRKASDGQQFVTATLVDTIFTLPGPMGDYSPQRNESNFKLAELARQTWEMVDASGKVTDFSAYDCFLIFHAGTGRDIDLTSLFGFDPTPRDIPSLFLGPAAFRDVYGQDYAGIVVNSGQDTIMNSGILPETESRLIPTVTGDFLLELSFNGLICASVASFLGLPDLFDTNTGRSAIGRFGLMDGQAIFSFLGVFPPEPSAWEKYYLGWIEPMVAQGALTVASLPAAGLATPDTVFRVPVTPDEYFLLENRQRDPEKNGQTVSSTFGGVPTVQTFAKDTTGFNQFDISALSGVVTDVQDLDWSLPGGVDEDGNRLDGGVLIWHVDETIIRREIRTNSVNADPLNRGVDLEEADGSQDIGQEYGFLSPGSGSEEGTPLDFWYDGNPVPVYENEFSSISHPSSASNSGGQSLVTVNQFSASGPTMSATISLGTGEVAPLSGFPMDIGEFLPVPSLTVGPLSFAGPSIMLTTSTGRALPEFGLEGDSTVSAPGPGKVFGWNAAGNPGMPGGFSDGRIVEGSAEMAAASLETTVSLFDLNGDAVLDVLVGQGAAVASGGGGASTSSLRAFTPVDSDGDSLADQLFETPLSRYVTTPPVPSDSVLAIGATGGVLYLLRFDGSLIDSVKVFSEADVVTGVSLFARPYSFLVTGSNGAISVVTMSPSGIVIAIEAVLAGNETQEAGIAGPAAISRPDNGSAATIAAVSSDGNLYVLSGSGQLTVLPGFPVNTGGACLFPPAFADIDGDGVRDVIVFSGGRILAYNSGGFLLDNFPVTVTSVDSLTSNPVVADVDGDSDLDIVAVTNSGLVSAYDRSGRLSTGFPLQAGTGLQSVAVFPIPGPSLETVDVGLAVASSHDGSVTAWKTGQILANAASALMPWPQFQLDAAKSGLTTLSLTGTPISSAFFPEDRVYNWPNPVYDNKTAIRFYVAQDAQVSIRIFDLAGDLVSELSGSARGGIDNEISWDVSDIQSGVYFARVEASASGGNGNAVIKIAVVK